jgi:hypothetical protein
MIYSDDCPLTTGVLWSELRGHDMQAGRTAEFILASLLYRSRLSSGLKETGTAVLGHCKACQVKAEEDMSSQGPSASKHRSE